ncbi:MAG TPA: imidazole glycerol phosphate synthase subunit HisF [Saprospiraceae bacterium]|nr:imidazole glycerol phosphate synthase subunit HisF [Saprospiraceae bacterium]
MIKRIIPCLLLKDEGLVKTIRFSSPKYVGDPINAVKIFNDKEADELMVIDIYATKEKREPNISILEDIVSEAFMPIGYGGGISTSKQITQILKCGVEKVVINYQAFRNIEFIKNAVNEFGSSTIVAGIDIKKNFWGKEKVYLKNGKIKTDKSPVSWAVELATAGVGEILINSIDLDGTYKGYDITLLQEISDKVDIPIIACGGAGSLLDIKEVFQKTSVQAAAAGSIFVYHGPHKAVLISYPTQEEIKNILK